MTRWSKETFQKYFPTTQVSKESACNLGDLVSVPGLGRSPGEGKGYPLQHSGLENSMGSIVHGGREESGTTEWLSLSHKLLQCSEGFPDGARGTCPPMQGTEEMWMRSLGREDPLEEEMASCSSILAWEIPRTEESGGLQSMGSQRVRHDWALLLCYAVWMEINSEKTVEETLDQKDEADARKKRYSGQRALLEDKARVTFWRVLSALKFWNVVRAIK